MAHESSKRQEKKRGAEFKTNSTPTMLEIIVTLKRKLIKPQIPTPSRVEALGGVKCKQGKASKNIQQVAYGDALIDALPPKKLSGNFSRRSIAIAGGES